MILKNTGLQHMMHGYIYDKNGNLVLETKPSLSIEERMRFTIA